MIHKEVSAEKFNALMKKAINLKECPKCGRYGAQIRVDFPMYGKDGAYCKCYGCGFETKRRETNIVMSDNKKRLGTPTIEKSLMGAIRQAVNDWNGKGNGKQTHISGNEAP